MKKKIFKACNVLLAVMIFFLSISVFYLPAQASEEDTVIRFHYHRPDGEYEKWSLWTWEDSRNGVDNQFVEGDDEVYFELVAYPDTRRVGFIVRTQEWEKDVTEDRFISLKKIISGTFDVYIEHDEYDVRIEYGEDVVFGDKFEDQESLSEKYSSDSFEEEYTYLQNDLGASYTKDSTTFKVWAPTADWVKLCLYDSGDISDSFVKDELDLDKGEKGVWSLKVDGDLEGTYYTYKVKVEDKEYEACDPYAKAVGINGDRAMVIDLDSTDPLGWESDRNNNGVGDLSSSIIYEISVRDFSSDSSSGVSEANQGKYLAFTEKNTTNDYGDITGIDYIKNLGVNYIQLMPIQDYSYLDEKTISEYNWGYGTKNFFSPEGSYSTDPYDGHVRVKETKEMIKAIHEEDMGVVLDVVYNHVFSANDFCFNNIVPQYFTRVDEDGMYSNGSYCGNDTATERAMVKKYIIDSVLYWVNEYHVDGFRFDLAGLIDVDTMNEIVEEVHAINPSILIYGEGWTMPTVSTKENTLFATQKNSEKTPQVGYFDDSIRNRVKGDSNDASLGYITGKGNVEEIKESLVGDAGWTTNPNQIINYVSCHDDATLWDKLGFVNDGDEDVRISENNLAAAIIYSAPGAVFMQAGEEMLRTKVDENGKIITNSYNESDYVNSIKWNSLHDDKIKKNVEYYKQLTQFRKDYLEDTNALTNATFIEDVPENVIAYTIPTETPVLIVYNPNKNAEEINLPEGKWKIYGENAISGKLTLDPVSSYRLVLQSDTNSNSGKITNQNETPSKVTADDISATSSETISATTKSKEVESADLSENANSQETTYTKKTVNSKKDKTSKETADSKEISNSKEEEISQETAEDNSKKEIKLATTIVDDKAALSDSAVEVEAKVRPVIIWIIAIGVVAVGSTIICVSIKHH